MTLFTADLAWYAFNICRNINRIEPAEQKISHNPIDQLKLNKLKKITAILNKDIDIHLCYKKYSLG